MDAARMIRTVVADDEELVLAYLLKRLKDFAEIEVLGQARDGQELLELVDRVHPLLVLMDIELPDIDGISVARQIQLKYPDIAFVFLTGYPEYAVQAFELDACDYLIKPISKADIARVLLRYRRRMAASSSATMMLSAGNTKSRLIVRYGNETYIIDQNNILYIEKVKRHSIIVTIEKSFVCSESLEALEVRISDRFIRSHRGYIINTMQIEKIEPLNDSSFEASFYHHSGKALISRNVMPEIVARQLQ